VIHSFVPGHVGLVHHLDMFQVLDAEGPFPAGDYHPDRVDAANLPHGDPQIPGIADQTAPEFCVILLDLEPGFGRQSGDGVFVLNRDRLAEAGSSRPQRDVTRVDSR
jgi:hypothetical protein